MRPLFALLLLASAACAAGPPASVSGTGARETLDPAASGQLLTLYRSVSGGVSVLPHPADVVWAALPEAYRELGIEPGHVDAPSRTLGNRDFAATRRLGGTSLSRYVSCGLTSLGLPREDTNRVQLSVLTTLSPAADGSTRVETRVEATTRDAGTGSGAAECSSTGVLEVRLSEALERGLAESRP